MSQVIAKV